jgi:energy-coupling factor transporter ATP-binding protein EcfA2
MRFGLNTLLEPGENEELTRKIIRVRRNFQEEFGSELQDYVEFFDENRYLYYSSVAANILFGAPLKEEYNVANLPGNEYFLKFLDEAQLTRPLMTLGAELARHTVDILGSLPPDEVFFEQSPISAEEIDDYKKVVERLNKSRLPQLSREDQGRILELGLRFIPGRHKMAALPEILEDLILDGRALFKEKILQDDPEAFAFYSSKDYLYSQTILENVLFGKTKTDNPQAQEKINQSIIQLLIEEDLLETIAEIGMDFQVGAKGDKLSGGQRQKLAIARVFLKNPKVLIMDEATSALDNKSQERIQNLLEKRWKGRSTLIAVVHRLDTIKNFDKVAVMRSGKIVEIGTYDELIAQEGSLYELVYGKKSAA